MKKYAEHALTLGYAKISSINLMINGHSLLHVYDVGNSNINFIQNPIFNHSVLKPFSTTVEILI